MPLATSADIEARLGRDLTAAEEARIDAILADVSASVIGYTGQTFDEDTTTDRLKIRNRFVRLPQRPVTAVTSVEDTDGNDVTHTWDGLDRIYLTALGQPINWFEIEPYLCPLRLVDVTYTHGYETVPADIVGVVCAIALRTLGQSPTDGAVVSEQIDGYAYRIGSTGAAGAFGLLPDEKAILDRYRRIGSTMRLAVP